jgi:hypothetical protein
MTRGTNGNAPPLPAALVVEETDACFIVRDGKEQGLAYVYFKTSRDGVRRPSCSPATRPGASPPTSLGYLLRIGRNNAPRASEPIIRLGIPQGMSRERYSVYAVEKGGKFLKNDFRSFTPDPLAAIHFADELADGRARGEDGRQSGQDHHRASWRPP